MQKFWTFGSGSTVSKFPPTVHKEGFFLKCLLLIGVSALGLGTGLRDAPSVGLGSDSASAAYPPYRTYSIFSHSVIYDVFILFGMLLRPSIVQLQFR